MDGPSGQQYSGVRFYVPMAAADLKDSEFFAEAEKTRMTLNPIPGTTLHSMIVEGLSMPAALKEKLKPILAPKG